MTDAMANLATLLHSTGKLNEAKEYYLKSLKSSPNNSILLLNYALCLSSLKYHFRAYEMIEKANLLNSNDLLISNSKKKLFNLLQNEINRKQNLINNIQNLYSNKNYDEVINNLLSYMAPVEDSAWWYYLLGMAYYYNKQYDLSIYHCNTSYIFQNNQYQNNSIHINMCLGLSYQSIGNYEKSIQYYEESYEILEHFETLNQVYIENIPILLMNITKFNIQNNLLKLYSSNLQNKKCILQSIKYFNLMNLTEPINSIDLLVFSYVKWSKNGNNYINKYQQTKLFNESDNDIITNISNFILLSDEVITYYLLLIKFY